MSKINSDAAEHFSELLLNTARWRREKAVEFPDDTRNIAAAEMLERLAGTVQQVHPDLLRRWSESSEHEDIGIQIAEFESEALRRVGFWSAPASAEELCQEIVNEGDRLRADLDAERASGTDA